MSSGICKSSSCTTKLGTSGIPREIVVPPALDLGEFNTSSVESLMDQYEIGIISSPGDSDPINKIIREYGSDPFYLSVSAVNSFLGRDEVKLLINAEDYPLLNERLSTGVAYTPVEVAEFAIEFGYTPTGLSAQTAVVSSKLLNELEAFYTKNFTSGIMGSFCSLMPNIFGAIDSFFTQLDDIQNLINKFKNFSIDFSLGALVNQIKNKIKSTVDKTIEKVKGIIDNFSIENIVSDIKTIINEKIVGKFQNLKEQAQKFFDPENIKNLKTKIDGMIDYTTNLFKNPTIEEIQFVIFRFCSFMSALENGINALKNPLDSFANSYRQTVGVLQSKSAGNNARAVTAGGIRYSQADKEAGINRARERFEQAGNVAPLGPEDFKDITQWNNGNGDDRIKFESRWKTVLGRDGWEKVDIKVRAMLMKVQKHFDKQLNVNSGWRSVAYNQSLNGSAKNSYHLSGLALDISWQGYNSDEREQFIRIARQYGFKGIGRYGPSAGNFVHIDVGDARAWSKGLDENDAYVTGRPVKDIPGPTVEKEEKLWTDDDARTVDALWQIKTTGIEGAGGSGTIQGNLTEGQRAYAISKGYINKQTPAFTLGDVGDRFDAEGNRIVPDPIDLGDAPFTLGDVR